MSFSEHSRARWSRRRLSSRRPLAAAELADMAPLKAHIRSVQTMTANFVQTDARGPLGRRHAAAQAAGHGSASSTAAATCCWSSNGKHADVPRLSGRAEDRAGPLNKTPLGMLLSDRSRREADRAQIVPNHDHAGPRRARLETRPNERLGDAESFFPSQRLRRPVGSSSTAGPRSTARIWLHDGEAVEHPLQRGGPRQRLQPRARSRKKIRVG